VTVLLIVFGVAYIFGWLFLGAGWARSLKFVFFDEPRARKKGCCKCGAPAEQVTWHRPASRFSLRTRALGWCQADYADYQEMRRRAASQT